MVTLKAQAVVWDFDETILNSFKMTIETLTNVMKRRSIPVPPHEVFVHNYHGLLRDTIKGICGVDEAVCNEIFEEFIKTEEYYYTEHTDDMYYRDALDLLQRNHEAGLKQLIVSNRVHHHDGRLGSPRTLMQKPPLAGKIEFVVCGDDNEFHKPDARMLDEAERALGLTRDQLLVVGDQFVDAELAHNLGVQAMLVSRSGEAIPHLDRLKDGWQDHVTIVKDLSEVSVLPL